MDDGVFELLSRGRTAAKVGEEREARFYLEWVLRRVGSLSPERLEAIYWLSEVTSDPQAKREYLTDILAAEPGNARARHKLAVLDGKIDPRRVIDPNRLEYSTQPVRLEEAEARRFTCPGCGGRMAFTPDGSGLTCDFCEAREQIQRADLSSGDCQVAIQEEDFFVGMATARGHIHSESTQFGNCQACGAEFILPPASLTLSCPYCDAAYVVTHAIQREMIAPAGVLPFSVSAREAQRSMALWLAQHRVQTDSTIPLPQGIYLPVWAFTMGGEIQYRGTIEDGKKRRPMEGSLPVYTENVLVPASPRLSAIFSQEAQNYDLDQVEPYDPRYLVDWIAENYTISVAKASLDARAVTFQEAKKEIRLGSLDGVSDVSYSSANLSVQGYKLLLLPAWIGHFRDEDRRVEIFINGQTGVVVSQGLGGVQSWLDRLFGS